MYYNLNLKKKINQSKLNIIYGLFYEYDIKKEERKDFDIPLQMYCYMLKTDIVLSEII